MLFSLNREHVAASAVEALTSLRHELWDRIAEHASNWATPPDGVVVFGSAARGDGGTASDIGLLVIRPAAVDAEDADWHVDVTDVAARVTRWSGNPCEILDRSGKELETMAAAGERLLSEIRRDGRAIVGSIALVPAPKAA